MSRQARQRLFRGRGFPEEESEVVGAGAETLRTVLPSLCVLPLGGLEHLLVRSEAPLLPVVASAAQHVVGVQRERVHAVSVADQRANQLPRAPFRRPHTDRTVSRGGVDEVLPAPLAALDRVGVAGDGHLLPPRDDVPHDHRPIARGGGQTLALAVQVERLPAQTRHPLSMARESADLLARLGVPHDDVAALVAARIHLPVGRPRRAQDMIARGNAASHRLLMTHTRLDRSASAHVPKPNRHVSATSTENRTIWTK